MIPKNTFADGLRYAAMIAGDFDPFTEMWSKEDRVKSEYVLDLLHKRLLAVADEYAPAEPEVRVGGEPPELEIGMVVTYESSGIVYRSLVPCSPCPCPNLVEVRAPWGGPVIWRAR